MSSRKWISFDLDTLTLRQIYPGDNWNNVYSQIKSYLVKNGFAWQQGSNYISIEGMNTAVVINIIEGLVKKYPYLKSSIRDIEITSVGRVHNLNEFIAGIEISMEKNIDTDMDINEDGLEI